MLKNKNKNKVMLWSCIVNEHCREDSALPTQFHFFAWKSDSKSKINILQEIFRLEKYKVWA